MLIKLDDAIEKLANEKALDGFISVEDEHWNYGIDRFIEILRAVPTVSDGWEDMQRVGRSLYFKLAVDELGIVNGSKLYDTGEYPEGTPETVHCLLEEARKVFGPLPAPPSE